MTENDSVIPIPEFLSRELAKRFSKPLEMRAPPFFRKPRIPLSR